MEYDASGSAPSTFGDLGREEGARASHTTAETGGETFSIDESSDDDFLLYVETRAPSSCYGLRIESLDMTPERVLTGTVRARDTSTEREECAAVETTPSRLARVRTEPAPPTHALLDVIDGWGEVHEVRSVPPQ